MTKQRLLQLTIMGNILLLLLGVFDYSLLLKVAGFVQTILLVASYYPQIRDLAKTHNASGISLSFWFMLDQALLISVLLAAQAFALGGGWILLVTQTLNLLLAIIVTVQVYLYKE